MRKIAHFAGRAQSPAPSRRHLLQAAAGAAGIFAVLGAAAEASPPPPAGAKSAPEEAIEKLLAGNKRYVEGRLQSPRADLARLRRETEQTQKPFAAVLSCSDSRLPVELVFDQSLGQIFVARIAGNITTPEIIASLEYGAAILGTKAILVLAHENCGALKAALAGKPAPGQISALYPHLQPAVREAGGSLEAAARANARLQASLLREASPVLSALASKGALAIRAGYYSLASGRVALLS